MSRRLPALGRDDRQLDARAGTLGKWHNVAFKHDGWQADYPDDEYARVNYTWGRIVGALKAYAESGKAAPFLG
jgi:hypothetical protein